MTRYGQGYEEKIGRYQGCDIYCVNDGAVPRLELRKPPSIWSKLVAAVRGWHVHQHFTNPTLSQREPLIEDVEDPAFTIPTINDAQRKNEKLAALARYRDNLRRMIDKKKHDKKRWRHLESAMRAAMTETIEIETGKRVWSDGHWRLVEGS